MKNSKYKIGDMLKTVEGSAVVTKGRVLSIVEGGENLGFPWKDDTPHYEIVDEATGVTVISHERNVEPV